MNNWVWTTYIGICVFLLGCCLVAASFFPPDGTAAWRSLVMGLLGWLCIGVPLFLLVRRLWLAAHADKGDAE